MTIDRPVDRGPVRPGVGAATSAYASWLAGIVPLKVNKGAPLLVIANEEAGSAERGAVAAAAAVLGDTGPVEVAYMRDRADLEAVLDRRGDRTVVVAGGDGSVHAVVSALHRRGELARCRLGLVPLGTGNDLARGLGVPLDPQEAARVVLAGPLRRLDLLVGDDGGVVLNAVHAGVGAEAARAAATWKSRLGRFAYPVGALSAGLRSGGWRLEVDVDGGLVADERTRVLMVALANGPSIAGGTAHPHPDAVPDDGLADVVVAHAVGRPARLGYALDLVRGTHLRRDDVVTARGRRVSVRGEPFRTVADGEVSAPATGRTWTVVPSAWQVAAPAHADRATSRDTSETAEA